GRRRGVPGTPLIVSKVRLRWHAGVSATRGAFSTRRPLRPHPYLFHEKGPAPFEDPHARALTRLAETIYRDLLHRGYTAKDMSALASELLEIVVRVLRARRRREGTKEES